MPDPNQTTDQSQNPAAGTPPVTPSQPPTPAAPATPQPPANPAAPVTNPVQPAVQPPQQPKTKQEWMMHLLGKIAPPQNVVTTNLDGTQTVENKATPVSLAHLVLTSALAGSFGTKNVYREGSYGPILDRQATNADAFNKGSQMGKDYSEAAQKQADDMQARKLTTVAANVAAVHQYASMQQAQFAAEKEGTEAEALQNKNWQDITDRNNATIGASADAYDQALTDKDAPKARLASNATFDELMNSPFKTKMTQQLMVQDGLRSQYDPATGRTKTVPTYSLYNPDVTLKLNKEAVDRAAKINPSFQGLYEVTGGSVPMNMARYATVTHQINSVDHAEDLLQSLSDSNDPLTKSLGITGDVEGRLATAVRSNPAAMKSLLEYESATAHGGSTADQLQRLLMSDGADAIFKALGTDRDKVQNYIDTSNNKRLAAQTLAKEGADKAPANPQRIAGFKSAVDKLPKEYRGPLYDNLGLDENGQPTRIPTNKDLDGMDNKILDVQKTVDKNALESATPEAIANQVQLSIGAGDLTKARDLYSMRRDTKAQYNTALENKAITLGLNPNHFNVEALNQKSKTQEDYQPNGKIGQNLTAFRAFIEHGLDAKVANDAWQRSGSPDLNKSIKWWDEHAANDQNFQRFRASIIAPAQEYMNFLKANHATTVGDEQALNAILKDNATPQTIYTALQTFTRTADDRLLSLGQGYVNSVGTTNPGLMTKTAFDSMKALGVDSRAKNVAGELPRAQSWVTNLQPQTLNSQNPQDKAIAAKFLAAASGDADLARSMAREHGYSF
jgi:hypothetical protein